MSSHMPGLARPAPEGLSPDWEPNCMVLAIGSLPHVRPGPAIELGIEYTPELVGWPQLPAAGPAENMYAQFAAGLPGLVVTADSAYCDRRSPSYEADLERLYSAHLSWSADCGGPPPQSEAASIGPQWARGLHALLDMPPDRLPAGAALKGQVTGPISFALAVTDQDRRPLLYDETLRQAATLLLRLKAAWQEWALAGLGKPTVLFLDEPYMATFGSAYFNYGPELVKELHEAVTGGLRSTLGVHCCGNTDWTLLLGGPARIVSFDAYAHAQSMALYPREVEAHLAAGGCLAWGIVPALPQDLVGETLDSLLARFEAAVGLLVDRGIDKDLVLRRALISPSCGLRAQSEDGAARALGLCAQISAALRGRGQQSGAGGELI